MGPDTWDHLRNRINISGTFSGSKNVLKTLILILRTFQNTDFYLGLQGSLVAVPDTWDHLRNIINFSGTFSGSKNVPKTLIHSQNILKYRSLFGSSGITGSCSGCLGSLEKQNQQ